MTTSTRSHLGRPLTLPHLFCLASAFFCRMHKHNRPTQRSPGPVSLIRHGRCFPLMSWHTVSIIAAPAVNCEAQVIVCKVDTHVRRRRAKEELLLSYIERVSSPHPLHPLLIRPSCACCGQCICHNTSTPCSSPHRGEIIHLPIHLQAWKPFIMRPETSINYSDGRTREERGGFLKGKYILI